MADPWADFVGAPSAPAAAPAGGDPWASFVQAAPSSAPQPSAVRATANDVARGVGAGVERGAIGVAGIPGVLSDVADYLSAQTVGRVGNYARTGSFAAPDSQRYRDLRSQQRAAAPLPSVPDAGDVARPEVLTGLVERAQGAPIYEPTTKLGQYARTATEFATGGALLPGGSLATRTLAFGAVPGLASEAAGQAAQAVAPAAEPYARVLGALGAGGVAAYAMRPSMAESAASNTLRQIPQSDRGAVLDRAQTLLDDARASGVPLSTFNAIDTASNGATNLSDLQRRVEAMGPGLRSFYAQAPERTEAAALSAFDRIAPQSATPTEIGPAVSEAARGALAATPEGQAAAQARAAIAGRVTADQAGQVIQPELRGVYDRAVQQRSRQGAVDYRAAEQAPERVGIDRTVTVDRPGEPVVTPYDGPPQFTPDAPAPVAPFAAAPVAAGPQPGETLARYIARNGGIAPNSDLMAAGLGDYVIPGVGRVVREGGKPLDGFWRQNLRETGYYRFDPDGYTTSDISNDLIRSLQNEQRGGAQVGRRPQGGQEAPQGPSSSAARDEYDYALSLAQTRAASDLRDVGVDFGKLHPDVQSRVTGAMMRGEAQSGADAYEAVVRGMREPPAPTLTPTTVQEQVSAPRFGQVNPQPVVDVIDGILRTAKGADAGALESVRRMLLERGVDPVSGVRELDLSIPGLHRVRQQIDDRIAAAQTAQRGTFARDLQQVRSALDDVLKSAPEMATADRNFALNSQAVEPFTGRAPLAPVVEQDRLTGRMAMPTERVPDLLQSATATREFLSQATPAARQAAEARVQTQIADQARNIATGDLSPEALRRAMQTHEDTLSLMPEVRQRLERAAATQEARDRLSRTYVGRLADRDLTTRNAMDILFPRGVNALPAGEQEIGRAVADVARQSPAAARQIVRAYAESLFNAAAKDLQGGPNPMGGARFVRDLLGNAQEERNYFAALNALPNGAAIAEGFRRFADVLAATGRRRLPGANSTTAFEARQLDALSQGGPVEQFGASVLTGGLNLPKRISKAIEDWRLGRNLDQLARLASDPDAVGAFRGLVTARDPTGAVARLVAIATRGAQDAGALRVTVQPRENAR